MKIYVASSWRNEIQPSIVRLLRSRGHEVYDFRNPAEGNHGFSWEQIDYSFVVGSETLAERLGVSFKKWSTDQYRKALDTPIAQEGFKLDFDAMKWADACVLVLPSGRSAHIEAGWMAGAGKKVVVYVEGLTEPELMYKIFGPTGAICTNPDELFKSLAEGEKQ